MSTRGRNLTAAYQLRPAFGLEVCASCVRPIVKRQRCAVNLTTGNVQCGPCYANGRPTAEELNAQGLCADCGQPCGCASLAADPRLAGAVMRCLGCASI